MFYLTKVALAVTKKNVLFYFVKILYASFVP